MDFFRNLRSGALFFVLGWTSVHASILDENFSFSGANYTVVGQFTYDSDTDVLQSITGNVTAISPAAAGTGGAISGLVAGNAAVPVLDPPLPGNTFNFLPSSGSANSFIFDDSFDLAAGGFSFYGILFSFGSGNYGNLYNNSGAGFSTWLPDGPGTATNDCPGTLYCPGDAGSLTFSSAVPELSSWAMMLLGFLCLAILSLVTQRLALVSKI